jgi:hypothetical protein
VCRPDPLAPLVFPPHSLGCSAVVTNSDSALVNAVARGPIFAAIYAAGNDFQLYRFGVFDGACDRDLDHAVTLVGYAPGWYVVRNSWGIGWGEAGFMRIRRSPFYRACGVREQPYAIEYVGARSEYPRRPLVVV